MNRPALILVLALPLMAFRCGGGGERPAIAFPTIPDLRPEVRAECPAASLISGELGDLATKDAGLAIAYAECQARHRAAVGAYDDAQSELARKAKAIEEAPR